MKGADIMGEIDTIDIFFGVAVSMSIIVAFVLISFILSYAGIYAGMNMLHRIILWLDNMFAPTHTTYLSSTIFPLKVNINNYLITPNPIEYAFYGIPQPNGTECISIVGIFSFNYTSQNFSKSQTLITNPKGVAEAYYTSEAYLNVTIPNGYTLLCPDIVNATK